MSRQSMGAGRQRQRHGVAKNLTEGVGGWVVGAALVVLIREVLKKRSAASPADAPATTSSPANASSKKLENPA